MTPSPRIAIIGAGPGGLILARLLKIQGIPFQLFELDESKDSRPQGGTLDIHTNSGQLALKEAGLLPEFQKHARADGAAQKFMGKDGTVFMDDDGSFGTDGPPDRPEIDRNVLRQILLDSLDEGTINWGKKAMAIVEENTSTRERPQFAIQFEDGEQQSGFELIVGADGAWSRVRPLLTDAKPFYSSVHFVECHVDDIDARYPDLAGRLGRGTVCQTDGTNGIIGQRLGDGSCRVYAMLKVEENWAKTCGLDFMNHEASKRALVDERYSDWEPLGKQFILRSDGPLIPRPLYMLPVEVKWETRPGLTVIGDAAHLMTPYAGVGVNLALTDALDLAHAIQSHVRDGVDWATALQEFEKKMFDRAIPEAERTYENLKGAHAGDSLESIAEKFNEFFKEDAGQVGSGQKKN